MSNVIFNALIAGGSGGGSVQSVDYIEIEFDNTYGSSFQFVYDAGDYQDSYYELDGYSYEIHGSETVYLFPDFTGTHNLKVHKIISFAAANDLLLYTTKVKRIASTLETCQFTFSGLGRVSYPTLSVDFTFPASDLELSACTDYSYMFSSTVIKSFPDIRNIYFAGKDFSFMFNYAYFVNYMDVERLIPVFGDDMNLTKTYTADNNMLIGTIPAEKTWDSGVNFYSFNQCFYNQNGIMNYQDAVNAGWA